MALIGLLLPSPSRGAELKEGTAPSPYLIIFTRHPGTEPSARYLLRHAAHLARDGHPMTLYLMGAAACADGAAAARAYGINDVYFLTDEERPVADETVDCQFRKPSQLSALMLRPGWQIYWC